MQVKGTIFDDLNAMKLVDDGLIDGIELENVFALKAKVTSADAQDAEGTTARAFVDFFFLKKAYLFFFNTDNSKSATAKKLLAAKNDKKGNPTLLSNQRCNIICKYNIIMWTFI